MSDDNAVEKRYAKIFVNVPYQRKETAKGLWFKYDGDKNAWYIQVRNLKDMAYLQPICYLFDLIDVESDYLTKDEVKEIQDKFIELSKTMLEIEKWQKVKTKLYYVKVKNVCNECFKVDFMDLIDGKCVECV
jgi:hypothetical protein